MSASFPVNGRVLSDAALAAQLATDAGQLLLTVRADLSDEDPSVRKTEGDRRSHELLMAQLVDPRPDDAGLSEEGVDDLRRLHARRVWIVDPLDGTREFSEPGRTDWAVHVALWTADCFRPSCLSAGAGAVPRRARP